MKAIIVASFLTDFPSNSLCHRNLNSVVHTMQAFVVLGIASTEYAVITYGIK